MLLLVSFLLFVAYLSIVSKIENKLPPSISDGYYILLNKKLGSLFFFFMIGIGLTFMIYGLNLYGDLPYSWLIFLAGGGLCFVGAASQFKEDFVRKIHIGAALVCGVSITLWTGIYGSAYLFVSLLVLFLIMFYLDRKRFILHAELLAFMNAYLQLYVLHMQGI